jgi:hypothetical protein
MLAFLGCASPYQREGFRGGYSENEMGSNRWQVTFSGNAFTSESQARSYAFRRAKEVCAENGFSDFEIQNTQDKSKTVQFGNYNTACTSNYYGQTNSYYGRTNCQTSTPTIGEKPSSTVVVQCKSQPAPQAELEAPLPPPTLKKSQPAPQAGAE